MARYADAIFWIAANDDTQWLDDEQSGTSVTAALVADLFSKTDEQVRADIRREVERQEKQKGRA